MTPDPRHRRHHRLARMVALAVTAMLLAAACDASDPVPLDGPGEAFAADGPFTLVASLPRREWAVDEPVELGVGIAHDGPIGVVVGG